MLDIGGESTRPGALPVGVQEELDRVLPIIEGLRGAPVPVSIDTVKPEVMRAAIAAGAQMVNDINALRDAAAMEYCCRRRCSRMPDAQAGRSANHAGAATL